MLLNHFNATVNSANHRFCQVMPSSWLHWFRFCQLLALTGVLDVNNDRPVGAINTNGGVWLMVLQLHLDQNLYGSEVVIFTW